MGLTGGIATGKSHVLNYLIDCGAWGIDADRIAREVVAPGQPAHQDLVTAFGEGILDTAGAIDRKTLGRIVFGRPEQLRLLNGIIHPRILEEEESRLRAYSQQLPPGSRCMVIVDAALMIEVGSFRKYDQILVTYCPPGEQLTRLLRRDRLAETEGRQRIASQMPATRKVEYADYVVETSEQHERTRAQVSFIYRELMLRMKRGEPLERSSRRLEATGT